MSNLDPNQDPILESFENTNPLPPQQEENENVIENNLPETESNSHSTNANPTPTEETSEYILSQYQSMERESLLAEMEKFSKEKNIAQIKARVGYLKQVFARKTQEYKQKLMSQWDAVEGTVKEETEEVVDTLEVSFKGFYDTYRENRKKYLEAIEKDMADNLQKKKQLLEDLKSLIESEETLKKTYDDFNIIQSKWKEIGQVARNEVNGLWQNYHFLIEQFFNKVKINRELRDLDLRRNLDSKIALCEKVEELLLREDVVETFGLLQGYQEQWREIGPVPSDKNEEIWERFRLACGKINKRRQEYYELLLAEQQSNLLAKIGICEKVEELLEQTRQNTKSWKEATDGMNEMLSLWKSIGSTPRTNKDEVWKRFKGTLDTFFTEKKDFLSGLKKEQNDNFVKKTELCERAEVIAKRDDWKQATQEIIALQKAWKEVGNTAQKYSDKLWKRFRAACDEFFKNKDAFFSESRAQEQTNKDEKEAIIKEVQAFTFGENREENLNAIKEFQRKWANVGFVPAAEKKRLQNEFRNAINAHFEKLDISIREQRMMSFKENVENLKSNNREDVLVGERHSLQKRMQQLQGEITLWENNLGFFAASKQANLLKSEFERKIEKNKQEIALLRAQIQMLKNQK